VWGRCWSGGGAAELLPGVEQERERCQGGRTRRGEEAAGVAGEEGVAVAGGGGGGGGGGGVVEEVEAGASDGGILRGERRS
jgi:hypothetical protein